MTFGSHGRSCVCRVCRVCCIVLGNEQGVAKWSELKKYGRDDDLNTPIDFEKFESAIVHGVYHHNVAFVRVANFLKIGG